MFITSNIDEGDVWIDTSEIFCFYFEPDYIDTDDSPNTPCVGLWAVLKRLPPVKDAYEIDGTNEGIIIKEDGFFHFQIGVYMSKEEAQTKLKNLLQQMKQEVVTNGQ